MMSKIGNLLFQFEMIAFKITHDYNFRGDFMEGQILALCPKTHPKGLRPSALGQV